MLEKNTLSPLITIALPVLNGGQYLALAIKSIQLQTYTNWELLIIDDGSTDFSLDKNLYSNDERIKVIIDGKNMGISARLNQAIDSARGIYFARMDHDDICHPERFAHQILFMEANPDIDLLSTAAVTINELDHVVGILPAKSGHDNITKYPWNGFYMAHPTWLGRVEWFRKYRYTDPGPFCCEDQELLLRAFKNSSYECLPDKLLAYRVRFNTPLKKLINTRLALVKIYYNFYFKRNNFLNFLLALFFLGIKVLKDVLRIYSSQYAFLNDKRVSDADEVKWKAIILKIKLSVKRDVKSFI